MASIRTNVLFSGLPELKQAIQKTSKKLSAAGRAGIYAAATEIIKDAKSRAPVDTGALKESGFATMPNSSNVVEMGFGGHGRKSDSGAFPEEYAVVQHEEDYKHTIGQSHYFLNAVNKALGGKGFAAFAKAAQKVFNASGNFPPKLVPETPEEGDA